MLILPLLPTRATIHQRLPAIFPAGTPNRGVVTSEIAASTIFTLLYLGAITDHNGQTLYWARPDQITRMNDTQAARTSLEDRLAWRRESTRRKGSREDGWYAANTRESIRDDTLRHGLLELGAVVRRADLPTTSPRGRYALTASFADLFRPNLHPDAVEKAIETWQAETLSPSARARIQLLRRSVTNADDQVLVTFPNGETRHLQPGPSSDITKAVVETFAPRFLERPGVLSISESGRKETYRDTQLLAALGIHLKSERLLPDLLLVDLGNEDEAPLFVFVEVVATDGAITSERRRALLELLTNAGYDEKQAMFLTAFADRDAPGFKKTASNLAWGSFAWFASEPDALLRLYAPEERAPLRAMMKQAA